VLLTERVDLVLTEQQRDQALGPRELPLPDPDG
jgi:hypothetical protein